MPRTFDNGCGLESQRVWRDCVGTRVCSVGNEDSTSVTRTENRSFPREQALSWNVTETCFTLVSLLERFSSLFLSLSLSLSLTL